MADYGKHGAGDFPYGMNRRVLQPSFSVNKLIVSVGILDRDGHFLYKLPEEIRALFQSDMRIVVDFLAQGADYRSDRKIKHKAALLKMLGALSGQRDTDDIEKWMEEQEIREGDEITVCELFDQYVRQGKKEGKEEGKAEGKEYGRARQLVTDIESLMKSFQVSLERACEGLGTTVSRYEEARKLI